MASNIVYTTIDESYPIAGQDNDSQGFRDNFNIIKNGLEIAATELTTLQADTAKLNADNNFNGSVISNATLALVSEAIHNGGHIPLSTSIISFSDGNYQKYVVNSDDDVTVNINGWPTTDVLAKFRLELTSETQTNILFESTSSAGPASELRYNGFTSGEGDSGIIIPIGTRFIDFWSTNGGETVFVQLAGDFLNV